MTTLWFDQALLLLAVSLTALAAISDLRTGQIPNGLVLCFAVTVVGLRGLGVALGLVPPSTLLHEALYGALFAACVPLMLYVSGGLGGGDLKLLVVCGAALGPFAAARLQLYAFMLGAGLVVLRLVYRGELLRTLWRSARAFGRRARKGEGDAREALESIRFAPAVLAAALLVAVERWS